MSWQEKINAALMRGVLPMPCVAVIQWRKEPDAGWWRMIARIPTFP
ncbi:hypothetical protein ACLK1U_04430 [Escherichia coli]